jgi:hypothetical protein
MTVWFRDASGAAVGMLDATDVDFIRVGAVKLAELVTARKNSAPVLMPFGQHVKLLVTTEIPDDSRLRAILQSFFGDNEPEYHWRYAELDFWTYLAACCRLAVRLIDEGQGRIRLTRKQQAKMFLDAMRCVGLMSDATTEEEAGIIERFTPSAMQLIQLFQADWDAGKPRKRRG